MSRHSSECRDKRPSKWLRKFVMTIFLLSQHKGLNIEEELCHENKTACRDRTWEECNQSVETKKDNVVTRFVSWMPTSGRTYRDIKALVATLEIGRKQKFCHDKVSYVATRYLMS